MHSEECGHRHGVNPQDSKVAKSDESLSEGNKTLKENGDAGEPQANDARGHCHGVNPQDSKVAKSDESLSEGNKRMVTPASLRIMTPRTRNRP